MGFSVHKVICPLWIINKKILVVLISLWFILHILLERASHPNSYEQFYLLTVALTPL